MGMLYCAICTKGENSGKTGRNILVQMVIWKETSFKGKR